MTRRLVALMALIAVIGLACGSESEAGEGEVLGAPADAADADRKVDVEASDDLRFDPSSLEVESGEVITFVVQNTGEADHEFVLGDAAYQEAHEEETAEDHDMMNMDGDASGGDNAITVGPGETKELTWEFDETGEVLFGCHEPGHYEGGMVGTIKIG